MKIIGIDAGLNGYIVIIDDDLTSSIKMPIRKLIVEPKREKKVGYYKNGKPKYKTTKHAKYKTEIDVYSFYNFIKKNGKGAIIVIEKQNGMAGNSARSSSTISFNYGQLIGSLKVLLEEEVIETLFEVSPQTWKRHFGILGIKDKKERKEASINKAKELGFEPKTHDEAEAFLIAKWYTNGCKVTNS